MIKTQPPNNTKEITIPKTARARCPLCAFDTTVAADFFVAAGAADFVGILPILKVGIIEANEMVAAVGVAMIVGCGRLVCDGRGEAVTEFVAGEAPSPEVTAIGMMLESVVFKLA
jgi:hypothetical protein